MNKCSNTTPSGGVGVAILALLSHMSSPTSFERSSQATAGDTAVGIMKGTGL